MMYKGNVLLLLRTFTFDEFYEIALTISFINNDSKDVQIFANVSVILIANVILRDHYCNTGLLIIPL